MFTPYKISFLIVALAALLNAQSIPVETENLARAVVFLYDRSTTDAKVATGFLLGVPAAANAPSQGATFGWAFLVTARHVVDPEWQGCLPEGQTNPTRIEMRLNTKNYKDADPTGTEYVVVNLQQDGRPLWYHHDNDDIDVAVIPLTDYTIAPLADKHWFRIFDDDAGAISLSWFATPKVFNTASIGSSVVTAGLVPELSRAKRNYLTYRFGRISNIFPESIDVPCSFRFIFPTRTVSGQSQQTMRRGIAALLFSYFQLMSFKEMAWC